MSLFLLIITVLLVTWLGVWLVRWLSIKSPPSTDRWHKQPTALHGGIGFYPVIAIGIIYIIVDHFGNSNLLNYWTDEKYYRS